MFELFDHVSTFQPLMACAVDPLVSKLPPTLGMEFRWKIRSMFKKSKSSRHNLSKKKMQARRSLRLNEDIKILQAEKVTAPWC
jgi:hypothetical protein